MTTLADHAFSSLTPTQVRAQPKFSALTDAQETLRADVTTIITTAKERAPIHLTSGELQTIMAYKLAFGQNRPALLGLIKRNSSTQVEAVSTRAFATSLGRDSTWTDAQQAMTILCELTGVGPATASLILSLFYPLHVPFFSDEATVDILAPSGGRKGIKYTHTTYKTLYDALGTLAGLINEHGTEGEEPVRRGELERAIWNAVKLKESVIVKPKGKAALKRKVDEEEDVQQVETKPKKRSRKKI